MIITLEKTMAEIKQHCAGCLWPTWGFSEKPTHEYCGSGRMEGQSYCSKHYHASIRSNDEETKPFVPQFNYQKKAA
ncbi:MAG: hypothetical protein ACJAU6_000882 [Alphaproteobacteria bacterium]|jgi:hypothetical protein